jgi:uncharacterized membrane protein
MTPRTRPLVGAGLLLGVGLGGFADGILLHQILQWHNMLSSRVPPTDLVAMKYNMLWDGLFHAFTWMVTLGGVIALFRAARRPDVVWEPRVLGGAMLLGWAIFNLVEGVIDHQVLGIHHVHPGAAQTAWDVGFLAGSAVLALVGASLAGLLPRATAARRRAAPVV